MTLNKLTSAKVQENRYQINKLTAATKTSRLIQYNHLGLGVLLIGDLFVVLTQCQAVLAVVRDVITQMTVHMNKMKILLVDLTTGRLTLKTISHCALKKYLGQITKYLWANAPTLGLPTSEENNLWHYLNFKLKTPLCITKRLSV